MTNASKTPAERAQTLATAIEAEQSATVTTRTEIAQAIEATHAAQDSRHESDITLLQKVRDRGYHLAELRQQVDFLITENLQHEMSVVSAVRANIVSRAQLDADSLIMPKKETDK